MHQTTTQQSECHGEFRRKIFRVHCPVMLKNLLLPVEFKFQQWLAQQVIQALPNISNLTFAYIKSKTVLFRTLIQLKKAVDWFYCLFPLQVIFQVTIISRAFTSYSRFLTIKITNSSSSSWRKDSWHRVLLSSAILFIFLY